MARQIQPRLGEPRLSVLDRRITVLETQILLLTQAVQELIRELEAHPLDEPAQATVRHAAELVLDSQRRGTGGLV